MSKLQRRVIDPARAEGRPAERRPGRKAGKKFRPRTSAEDATRLECPRNTAQPAASVPEGQRTSAGGETTGEG